MNEIKWNVQKNEFAENNQISLLPEAMATGNNVINNGQFLSQIKCSTS